MGEGGWVARENAVRKAREVAAGRRGACVIACDTVVDADGRLLGKPENEAQARAGLEALSGRAHVVSSGLCVIRAGEATTSVTSTRVLFRALDAATLDWYAASEEWRGRAGGYAIQGRGAALVAGVEGDYQNVVGLPLSALLELVPDLLRWSAAEPV